MRRYLPYIVAAGIVVVLLATWYLIVFQGQSSGLEREKERLAQAQRRNSELNAMIARREEMKRREPQTRAALVEFKQNVPDTPDLAEFIWANYDIARQAGVTWMSVAPKVPTASKRGGQEAQLDFTINVKGGYFQLLDYLIRLEKLRRTVVVDSLTINAEQETGGRIVSANLAGRMFTTKPNLPWTPSDTDMALIYPPSGEPTQRGQIPGPPDAGCTPPQPGFSEGEQPNILGNCSGQPFVPNAAPPVPNPPAGYAPQPGASPPPGTGAASPQPTAPRPGP